jgi:hypothetical protein
MNDTRKTDWVTISIPGRDEGDNDVAWFAYSRETRASIRFSSRAEAERFVRHPDNQRE